MAAANGNPGISKLAKTISERSRNITNSATNDLVLDFGKIQNDLSLLTNSFPIPIPKGDYSVLRHVSGLSFTSGTSNQHTHKVAIPKLKRGDSVLVAWVDDDPVVLDVIVSSSKL